MSIRKSKLFGRNIFFSPDFDVKTSGVSSSTDSSTCHDIPTVAAAKPPLAASETAAVVGLLTAATNCNVTPGSQDLEHVGAGGSSTDIIDSWTWGNTPGKQLHLFKSSG
jgi:hypothetical protein